MKHPFLTGERIYLRRIEREDFSGRYFDWLNDQEVTQWMGNGIFPNSSESMEAYYKMTSEDRSEMNFAICMREDDFHIGNIGLHKIHPVFRSAEVGLIIGERDYWGRGYGTEAIKLVSRHAFLRMNINRLYAGAVVENKGCVKAFEKAGFQREGLLREAYFCGGSYVDCVNLSLLRKEWEEFEWSLQGDRCSSI